MSLSRTDNAPALFEPIQLAPAQPITATVEAEEATIPLSHYFWIIRRQAWKIAAFVTASLVITYIVSSRLQPVYEATATITIDREAPVGLVGDESQRSSSSVQDVDQYISTQMRMILSDAVLRPIARKFNLLEREGQIKGLPAHKAEILRNSPTKLKHLTVSRPANTYIVQIGYRSPNPQLAADVANAIGESYVEHIYRLQANSAMNASGFMERQLGELKARMERSGQALAQFERELNVVNPEEKINITSSRLLQLNTEYTNAQADRVKKEAIYEGIRSGSLAAEQISGQADDLEKLQDRINEAQQRFAEIRASKGPNHPDYRKADVALQELMSQYQKTREQIAHRIETDYRQSLSREVMLREAVGQTKSEFDMINARSFDYQRLKDEADADKKLYEELVRKIQEAGINAGFENRNTAIADAARPGAQPVFPNLRLNLALAGFLSMALAVAASILVDSLDATVRDPEEISRLYHTDLIGTLPLVRSASFLTGPNPQTISSSNELMTAEDDGATRASSSFKEAIRMLRNSILLTDFDRRVRSILLTSATPGDGKSTTAVHLAIANAQQGKKTLLIDADLRKPTLHKKLGLTAELGLSTALTGETTWEQAIIKVPEIPDLHLLTAGPPSRRATDLVGSGVADILDEAARLYDLIIIDAPPIIGFAEPMQLAIAVDGVVLVAVSGETNRKAITSVVAILRRLKANLLGMVLNRITRDSSNGYYYYGYSDYYYGRQNDARK